MRAYICKAGEHAFRPSVSLNIGHKTKLKGWWVNIPEEAAYTLEGDDQKDWNKLAGLSFSILTNHKDSAMFGWRWKPGLGMFEINAYCHVNMQVVMTETLYMAKPNKEFACWLEMDYKRNTVRFHIWEPGHIMAPEDGHKIEYEQRFGNVPAFSREIGAWFGGNNTAPHQMILWKDKIIYYGN